MSLECPSCETEIEQFSRTGNKRYACGSCARVIKYDTVQPHLDEIPVNDKRNKGGDDKDNSQTESQQSSSNDSGSDDEQGNPVAAQDSGRTDREIIREEGYKGLKRIKEKKLKEWLATTDGVGGKTESRILKVFREESMYSEEPSTLYNLLDDELSASPSYINTIVNSVFSAEYEHEDLLQQQGYTPFFRNGGQSNQGGRNNMNGGYSSGGGGYQGPGGNQQQGQQQQGGGGNDGLTREEAMQMIQASQQSDDQGSRRRGPGTEALDEATEAAIKNMADNMGGFFGMLQRVGEEALVTYFRENPEKLVENMTLVNAFMNETSQQEQDNTPSEQDAKIDSAVQQAMSGGGGSQQVQEDPVESHSSFRTPSHNPEPPNNSGPDHSDDDSGFEMDPDVMGGGGSTHDQQLDDKEPQQNTQEPEPQPQTVGPQENDRSNNSSIDSDSGVEESGDDEWDKLFGDLEE